MLKQPRLTPLTGQPDGLIISHLPFGPTAYFGLSNVVMRHDINEKSTVQQVHPHLIFDNFTTPLGERLKNILKVSGMRSTRESSICISLFIYILLDLSIPRSRSLSFHLLSAVYIPSGERGEWESNFVCERKWFHFLSASHVSIRLWGISLLLSPSLSCLSFSFPDHFSLLVHLFLSFFVPFCIGSHYQWCWAICALTSSLRSLFAPRSSILTEKRGEEEGFRGLRRRIEAKEQSGTGRNW